jgi:hypothetical protein
MVNIDRLDSLISRLLDQRFIDILSRLKILDTEIPAISILVP